MKNLLGKFNIEKIKHLSCEKRPGNLGGSRSRLIRQSLSDSNPKTKFDKSSGYVEKDTLLGSV